MAKAFRGSSAGVASRAVLGAILVSLVSASAAAAETASMEDLVSAVVRINTHINPEGRTIQGLGREREGSGSQGTGGRAIPKLSIGRIS